MKGVYVCGSFRFTREMDELASRLAGENIEYEISRRRDSRGIMGCLKKIDVADAIYIVNPGGYVGKSVSVDIGYAYAKNKSIYAMHPVHDPPVMDLVNAILSPKALIGLLKKGSSAKT